MKKQDPWLVVLLTVFTCGLYYFIWLYINTENIHKLNPNTKLPSGLTVVLLSILTCGLYSVYWFYCWANELNTTLQNVGSDKTIDPNKYLLIMVVVLLLSCCMVWIIGLCILLFVAQTDMNNVIDIINRRIGGMNNNQVQYESTINF